MALTFTKRYEGFLDRKKLKIFDVTHDGSETSIDCSSLNLNYIDIAFNIAGTVPLSATSTKWADLTTNNGLYLGMTALSSGAITTVVALGT